MEEGKRKNNKDEILIIICLITVIILVLITGYLVYKYFKNDSLNDKQSTDIKDNVESYSNLKEMNYHLNVYRYDYGEICVACSNVEGDYVKAFEIKTETENAKILAVDDFTRNSFVLYDDAGLKIYNVKSKSIQKINLKNIYDDYEIFLSEDRTKVIGIGYLNNNYIVYYNVPNQKVLYNNKYKNDSTDGNYGLHQVNNNYISIVTSTRSYLLNALKEEVKLSHKNDEFSYGYTSFGENGKYIYVLSRWYTDSSDIIEIYSNSMNSFYKAEANEIYLDDIQFVNNNLYLNEGKKIVKYDINGNILLTSKSYDNLKLFSQNYVAYIKSNDLVLENIDDNSESKVLGKWNSNWNIDFFTSGYYTREHLDNIDEKNKEEGLYVVINYPEQDKNGNFGIEYCYTKDKKIISYPVKDMVEGRAKPVLYLYPESETYVTIEFAHPEYLTTTYPKYDKSWNVLVKPNGDMKDEKGKYYYALYWDEKRYNEVDFEEGFYVESKDAIKFLEEKLSIIGLNDRERNEFIMYWLPIIENNKKNLVYFELTEERELGNKLIINPKPDSLLRISIHIKKVNEKINIKEQKLETFNRSGFTAVEWGGMVY